MNKAALRKAALRPTETLSISTEFYDGGFWLRMDRDGNDGIESYKSMITISDQEVAERSKDQLIPFLLSRVAKLLEGLHNSATRRKENILAGRYT